MLIRTVAILVGFRLLILPRPTSCQHAEKLLSSTPHTAVLGFCLLNLSALPYAAFRVGASLFSLQESEGYLESAQRVIERLVPRQT